ncbi:type II CAAX prenyl endopeptidase Rce1 family protein [Paenibacillus sp. NPDC057934]|uniref:CPBP family glutamic-type intramembrane protease n=1 Tax=Paenibacillus sp. NPDC057934 TaxID=3346282 RepID=UPI0036DD7237
MPLLKVRTLDFLDIKDYRWLVGGILLGILCILPKWREWRIAYSKDFILLNSYQSTRRRVYIIVLLIAIPFAEEYFFRYFILHTAPSTMVIVNVLLSAFLFFLSHYGTKWSSTNFRA